MKDYCNLFCLFPGLSEGKPIEIRGYGVNPATAIAEAVGETDALYERSGREDRQTILAADPESLSIEVAVQSPFGLCLFNKHEGFQFHYSDTDRNPLVVVKRCKNLLEFVNNTMSGFLAEYAKWLMGKRRESKKGGNGE